MKSTLEGVRSSGLLVQSHCFLSDLALKWLRDLHPFGQFLGLLQQVVILCFLVEGVNNFGKFKIICIVSIGMNRLYHQN